MKNNYNNYDCNCNCNGEKKKARVGAIVRIAISALFAVVALIASVAAVIDAADRGIGACITDGLAALGLMTFVAVVINLLIIGMGYVIPRGFRAACSFWRAWRALTFLGVVIKFWVFIIIFLFPLSILTTVLSSACFLAGGLFMGGGYNIITSLVILAVSGVGTVLVTGRDIRTLLD